MMILLYWKEEGKKKEAIVFVQESRVVVCVCVCHSFSFLFLLVVTPCIAMILLFIQQQ